MRWRRLAAIFALAFALRLLANNRLTEHSTATRTVAKVISLCKSLKDKSSPASPIEWKPEVFNSFLRELDELKALSDWTFHVVDHFGCSSPERHQKIRQVVGPQRYTLIENGGRECGSYFRYILDHYDTLKHTTTIFVHGGALSHLTPQFYSFREIRDCLNFDMPFAFLNPCRAFYSWTASPSKQNKRAIHTGEQQTCLAALYANVSRYNPHFPEAPSSFRSQLMLSAQFAVHRSRILANPRSLYEQLYSYAMTPHNTTPCPCAPITPLGCDRCLLLEHVWWLLMGDAPRTESNTMAYDHERTQPRCRGPDVRDGFTPLRELVQQYELVDDVDSSYLAPYVLSKTASRRMCNKIPDGEDATIPVTYGTNESTNRITLLGKSYCDSLDGCSAFAVDFETLNSFSDVGSVILFTSLTAQDVRAGAIATTDTESSKLPDAFIPVPESDLFEVKHPELAKVRDVSYLTAKAASFWKKKTKLRVYVRKTA